MRIGLPWCQAGVALPSDACGLRVHPIEVLEHRANRREEAVEIEAIETCAQGRLGDSGVEGSEPLDEAPRLVIAPHPRREARERGRLGTVPVGQRLHVTIDTPPVGPVCLNGDDAKSTAADELPGDAGAQAIELGGAMRGLPDQHQLRVADPLEQRAEVVARRWTSSGSAASRTRRARVAGRLGARARRPCRAASSAAQP